MTKMVLFVQKQDFLAKMLSKKFVSLTNQISWSDSTPFAPNNKMNNNYFE